MLQVHKLVEIRTPEKLNDTEMRVLGKTLDFLGFDEVIFNRLRLKTKDMGQEGNTWDKVWEDFDSTEKGEKVNGKSRNS